jgi:hypothetical protein
MNWQTIRKLTLIALLLGFMPAAGAYAQVLLIVGAGGQLIEVRRDGSYFLHRPDQPPAFGGGGYLSADGLKREYVLIDFTFGSMVHAEARLADELTLSGYGRVQAAGPWPLGRVTFAGLAFELPEPDEEREAVTDQTIFIARAGCCKAAPIAEQVIPWPRHPARRRLRLLRGGR